MLPVKPTVVIGMGQTGLSIARYLHQRQVPFTMQDTRENPPGLSYIREQYPDVSLHCGSLHETTLLQAKQIVISPGLATDHPALLAAKKQGIPLIGDIELFVCAARAPIIAITGSNGKSTVTTLTAHLLAASGKEVLVGGNLGIPALDLLEKETPDFYVLELSSFQLETTFSLKNHVACILNISSDHLDRYATIADYIAVKQRIYDHAQCAIYNAQDLHTYPVAAISTKIQFSNEAIIDGFGIKYHQGDYYLCMNDNLLINTKELHLQGKHHWSNALAALALCHAVGVEPQTVLHALITFTGLAHRTEWVAEINQITWYNDSKGTNVGATLAALNGLGSAIAGKIIWLAGGMGKGACFNELAPPAQQFVRHAILFGEDAKKIASSIANMCPITFVNTFKDAMHTAATQAQPGDCVLLSPACASFDMFKDFTDRGEQFKQLVKELADE